MPVEVEPLNQQHAQEMAPQKKKEATKKTLLKETANKKAFSNKKVTPMKITPKKMSSKMISSKKKTVPKNTASKMQAAKKSALKKSSKDRAARATRRSLAKDEAATANNQPEHKRVRLDDASPDLVNLLTTSAGVLDIFAASGSRPLTKEVRIFFLLIPS